MSPTVLTLITDGLREVKDAVTQLSRDMNTQMSKLPEAYVPRREVERRFDELIVDVGAERADRQRDVQAAKDRVDQLEERLIAGRRWVIGVGLGAGISGIGLVVNIISQLN